MRDFLLYVACPKGECKAELFGSNRLYDVAINDYTENNIYPEEAEYKFSINEYKYRHIKKDLADIVFNYKVCAFFDDDVEVSTEDLNKLFTLGYSSNFNIWQASLTKDSYSSWGHLYVKDNSDVREINQIELMMPFFSKSALEICWDTFDISYGGWGIEIVWISRLKNEKIMAVDSIPVKHMRPICSSGRVMPNGLLIWQECENTLNYYGVKLPKIVY